jgi:hypothetical protein
MNRRSIPEPKPGSNSLLCPPGSSDHYGEMACVSLQEGRQGRPHGDGFYHPWPQDGDVQGRVGRPLHLTEEEGASCLGDVVSTVRYHCGGWSEEVNSCILNSYMVYL